MLEEKNKEEKKSKMNEDAQKLGSLVIKRSGSWFEEVWEEGEEFKRIRTWLQELASEKENLEKLKRRKRPITSEDLNDEMSAQEEINTEALINLDREEQKEIIQFKLSLNQKEEQWLKDQLALLEKEKYLYQAELKR